MIIIIMPSGVDHLGITLSIRQATLLTKDYS